MLRSASIRALTAAAAITAITASAPAADAQAWNYPSFQQPTITPREFNFLVADGGKPAGTSLLVQWRQQAAPRTQFSLDAGLADGDYFNDDTHLLIGGQIAQQLATASATMPLDLLFTGGINGAFGDPFTLLRIPVGVSLGHRFRLQDGMSIAPYAHPRISFDRCGNCGPVGDSDSGLGFDFDLGADFRFAPSMAVRFSAMVGGSHFFDDRYDGLYYNPRGDNDGNAVGLSFAWTPGTRTAPAAPPRRTTKR